MQDTSAATAATAADVDAGAEEGRHRRLAGAGAQQRGQQAPRIIIFASTKSACDWLVQELETE